ncbi:MAG: ABC transporter substrate-binding protein [Cyanobacteria bacterium J06631_9]
MPNLHLYSAIQLSLLGLLSGCATQAPQVEAPAKTVTIASSLGSEPQAQLEAAIAPFEEETGIDVVYEFVDDIANGLIARVDAGNAPDMALLPQPTLIKTFADADAIAPLSTFLEATDLNKAYADTWLDLATVDDEIYAVWYRASVKSLVWYNPATFERQGYDIPRTWEQLIALSDQIVADGGTPWCLGLESGPATGWPGTDWIEDLILRTSGPEAYRQWINHQITFQSEPVLQAFNTFQNVVLKDGYVKGGAASTATIPFREAADPLFQDPPGCYLHKQGNFIAAFFPPEVEARIDVDVFPLPAIDERFGTPLLVAGDAFVMFNDTPEARQLMEYFTTPAPHEAWAALGGFISPHQDVSLEAYPDLVSQKVAQILSDAEVIRFDGSDVMPSSVGAGTFWTGMVDFTQGQSAEEVTKAIDDSWPE